jgi:hypothetical protein
MSLNKRYNQLYDWDSIREEYVIGYYITDPDTLKKKHWYPTLQDIKDKYGMNWSYLRQKSAKEGWSIRREALQAKLREKSSTNTLHSYISDSAQFDAMTLIAMKKLYRLVEAYFDQYDMLITNPDGTVSIRDLSDEDKEDMPPIRVSDLKGLVETLDKAQALVRRTVGEPIFGAQEANTMLADEIFNPMVEKDRIGVDGKVVGSTQVDKLIAKRTNTLKTAKQMKEEMEALRKELADAT